MRRITGLEIQGWMPFAKKFRLVLPSGPIAIVGRHAGDSRRSNRAGKTALLEAVRWCLYGVHRKRLDDAIINRSCDACEVRVEFDDFVITRSRKRGHSTRLVVETPGADFTGVAAQQEVERVLGLTLDDFMATTCFGQGEVDAIINRGAGERLALVSEWLQQTKWLGAKKLQSARVARLHEVLATKRGALENAKRAVLTKAELVELQRNTDQQRATRAVLEKRVDAKHAELFSSIQANEQLNKHRTVKELRTEALSLRTRASQQPYAKKRVDALALVVNQKQLEFDRTRRAMDELQVVLDGGFDGQCPVMCEACPVADHVEERASQSKALYERRAAEHEVAQASIAAARRDVAGPTRELEDLMRASARYQSIVDRGKQLAAEITMTEAEATAAPKGQPIQFELETLRQEFAESSRQLGEFDNRFRVSQEADEIYARLVDEIEACEEAATASHLALKAISSVPARIAQQQLGELEAESNILLQGTGVSLRFSWQRELSDKAPICNECGFVYASKRPDECPQCHSDRGKKLAQELEFLCDDGSGAEEDVRYNSGGTKAIVGSSLRLGASAMLRRLRSSQIAFALVDEPFGALDAENREQLARMFAGMLATVGLEQALVVSHDAVLLDALPHRIVIDKDGSESTARLE